MCVLLSGIKTTCCDIEIILNIEVIDVALLFRSPFMVYGLISGLNSNRLWAQKACNTM